MPGQLSLVKTFLLAAWVEAIVYGFLCCIFGATMFVYFSPKYSRVGTKRDIHTTSMIMVSGVMFFMATFHLAMNGFRLIRGYADFRDADGGPVAYIGNLRRWDHILKDTIYATQENLGSAAAIYRTWTLWSYNWKIIVLPSIMLMINIVAGYIVCGTYSSVDPTATVFLPRLNTWIKIFYSMAVALNIITTGLMAWRIYSTHMKSANYNVGRGRLISILRILIESAALQLIVEIVLLALYCSDINAQYILLESVTSVVAITFNTITLRIKLDTYAEDHKYSQKSSGHQVQTIGSIPMKRIQVNINHETVDNNDDRSFNSHLGDREAAIGKA
ncbi:hypothetical protein JR316_0005548 [Psilocybe cubensis]|uniref:Uncharacterized protein n=2 Tax=Psilocybe cubensis TaxID=181762 RepID=A0ACB8GZM2_PSICU|nr:hypothetical protein JR316_0005548 [Psilocybe cubensis]KAH9481029.1 hypothetical protein JR316_0005548 [Psilocybe cubensis]